MKCSSGIVIVLVFMLGQIHGDSVKQMEGQVTLSEEASLTINCTFSTSTTPTLFWYVQYLGEGPQILLKALRDKEKGSNKGFEATLDISSKSFHLKKGSVQMSDSAVYYCALRRGSGNYKYTFGKGTKLKVLPNVQDPDPSVYQMRSPKTGRTVCLFTDFDSQADFQKPEGATVISLNSTVLDMKVMDSKSNGALTWNSETNIECKENFQQPFYPSSNYSCDAKLIEKSFETDMDLNFYNLLVIGLRILLLKVIGFNLFMTLRLWSC
ncbi:T-cell receptor alpha chain C region isoform X3 [Canis lupus familiaris]|uniref:T-cell receptor alpha chain C region isoform X3 n=1 Tax=Canis lupus familiaris TaxID=9615 RepID=UPI0018F3AAD9|nr:T-cell receptor alpha chain C region isoform X3 [Canis lupus familiaris]XP_038528997.1 T-cell receptor alpha chain C region isoform X3 [Canis lupus familiaris]